MNIYMALWKKNLIKSDKKHVYIVTHKLKKTKERTIMKIIMQSNTDIWIYKIEALEHSINTNVVNDKLNIIHI